MYEEFIYRQAVRQTKQDMLKVGVRLAEKGLLIGKGGNYSVRIGESNAADSFRVLQIGNRRGADQPG